MGPTGARRVGLLWAAARAIAVSVVVLGPAQAQAQAPARGRGPAAHPQTREHAQVAREHVRELARIPEGAVAYWFLEPGAIGGGPEPAQRAVIDSALRIAMSSGLAQGDAAEAIAGLLAASAMSSAPSRVCVLDVASSPVATDGAWELTRLAAVVEVRANDHRPLIETVRSIFVEGDYRRGDAAAQGPEAATQRLVTLPGGIEAAVLTKPRWHPWGEIAWTSEPGVFTLAIGPGTLQRWIADRDWPSTNVDIKHQPWLAHRRAISDTGPRGDVFCELFVDIDKLRAGFDSAMVRGRMGDVLNEWRLGNARQFMLHGRLVHPEAVRMEGSVPGRQYAGPPLVELDASFEARSQPAGFVGTVRVAEALWPAWTFRSGPPDASHAMVIRADPSRLLAWALASHRATLKPAEREEFNEQLRLWNARHRDELQRVLRSFEREIVLCDSPAAPLAIPGLCTVMVEARDGVDAHRLLADLRSVLANVDPSLRYAKDSVSWTVPLLPEALGSGAISAFSLGLAGPSKRPMLVAGFGWAPIRHAQQRLGVPVEGGPNRASSP